MNTPHTNLRTGHLPGQLPVVTPTQLAELLKTATPPLVLDVREGNEVAQCKPTIESWAHIPMSEVPQRLAELPKHQAIAVLCRAGGRSATITRLLKAEGFDAHNVHGGMLAWKADVEPTLPDVL
jgi:rhodanese-related sulfurtransferase